MTNKDIYLSLNRQDETSVKKLLTNHKLEKEYTYNNDYTNDYVIVESDSSLSWAEIE